MIRKTIRYYLVYCCIFLIGSELFAQGVSTNLTYQVNVDIQLQEKENESFETTYSPKAVRLYKNATELFLQKNYSDALSQLLAAIEKEPNFYEAHYLVGLIYMKNNQNEKAISHFEKALRGNEKDRNVYYQLGLAYKKSGNLDKAWEVVNTGLEKFPDEKSLLYLKGEIAYERKDYETVKSTYESILQIEETPLGYYYVGVAQEKLQQYNEAKIAYENALKLDSTFTYAAINLGYLYYLEGDCKKAISYFNQVLAIQPENLVSLYYKGMCAYTMGNKKEVETIYNQLLALDKETAQRFKEIIGE